MPKTMLCGISMIQRFLVDKGGVVGAVLGDNTRCHASRGLPKPKEVVHKERLEKENHNRDGKGGEGSKSRRDKITIISTRQCLAS